ncbi:MAG: SdrD B-like domain-containing protein [Acidimicrobiales bacterium]
MTSLPLRSPYTSARRRRSSSVAAFAVTALVALSITIIAPPTAAAPAPITGTVVRDFDHDGVADGDEPGVDGVTVTATAPDGTTASTTTDLAGGYTLSGLDDTITYRVEFSWTDEWLSSGPAGSANGSSVQFAAGGDTVDFALTTADDFCEIADADLGFVTTCFVNGQHDNGDFTDRDAIVAITGDADGRMGAGVPNDPEHIALNSEIGSTYGLAHQPSNDRLFTAAFLKRHVGLGDGGIDAIYELAADGSTTPTVWYDAIDAGTVADNVTRGLPNSTAAPTSVDAAVFPLIYKVGWGDIDLSPDEETLYGVNLFDRSVYAIDVAAADAGSTTAHTNLGRPAHTCTNGVDRLFGIEIHDGTLWAAVTCTGEQGGTEADISAAVYGLDLTAGTWAATPALQFDLDYAKGCMLQNSGCDGFDAWMDTFSYADFNFTPNGGAFEAPARPQAIVSDLEIDRNGVLIIGIRDRQGEQFGHRNEDPTGTGNLVTGMTAGDLLAAAPDGSGGWILESAGAVAGGGVSLTSSGAGTTQRGPGGPASGQGPGGGEFYWDEFVESGGSVWHSETSLGSLALAPGRSDVAVTNFDPLVGRLDAAGVSWFSNTNGAGTHEYELYQDPGNPAPATSGKANGLGDIESMCPAAPVEIGNRVWFDADNDGVQDPDEAPIPDVTVTLSDGQTTTTDANGQWVFTVAPTTAFTVTIDPTTADVSGIGAVATAADLLPTSMDLGGSDTVDSDMDPTDLTIDVTSGAPGENDHTLDAGFNVAAPTHEIGNLVWLDADNDGVASAGEAGIAGVTVELLEAGAVVATTTTDADGHYAFSGLDAGTYTVRIPAQDGPGQALEGFVSSTPTDAAADNDGDNDDNGIDPAAAGDPVVSGAVVIGSGSEPTDEELRSGSATADESTTGTPDDNSNLTVDFGFFRPASLGDVVWIDTNDNGQQDPGEPGVPDVTVNLCDADGNVIATTTTAADGSYRFDGLPPGDYCVCFDLSTLPDGYQPTGSDRGDDATDSDVDPATGCTPITSLDPGEHDPTLDLGIVPTVDASPSDQEVEPLPATGSNASLYLLGSAFLLTGLGTGLLALRRSLALR